MLALIVPALPAPAAGAAARATSLMIDVDCDGRPDRVVLEQSRDAATVRVIYGDASRRSTVFTFGVGAAEAALCRLPARLERESSDVEPSEAAGPVPGFRRSKTCQSFALTDDACDAFHFYWNHDRRRVAWWRA